MKSFYLALIVFTFLFIACDEPPENQPMQHSKSTYERELEKGAREIMDRFMDKNSIEYANRFPEKYKEYQKRCGLPKVEPCCK